MPVTGPEIPANRPTPQMHAVWKSATLWAAVVGAAAGVIAVRFLSSHVSGSVLARGAHGSGMWLAPAFRPPLLLSIALWVVFSVYWELAAKNAAPVERAESAGSRRIHLVLVSLGQALVLLPIPGLRARFLPASLSLAAVGLAVQLGCLWLAIWARRCLGRNWSGAIATTVDQRLVRTGPYRIVRHPIYSAVLGMYLGTAVVSGEIHALLGCAVLIVAYWRKIRLEELHLQDALGPAYRAYSDTTWRLIPGLY